MLVFKGLSVMFLIMSVESVLYLEPLPVMYIVNAPAYLNTCSDNLHHNSQSM